MTDPKLTAESYKVLWAKSKPKHPLWKHLLDSAAVALLLPFPYVAPDWTAELIAFFAGIHDIGKSDSFFQFQAPEFAKELREAGYSRTADAKMRHERISAGFIKKWLLEKKVDGRLADALARSLLAHHGKWDEGTRPVADAYADAQRRLLEMLYHVLGSPVLPDIVPKNLSAFGICLSGHIVLSDWIASNEDFFADVRLLAIEDPKEYFLKACEVAEEWVEKLGIGGNSTSGRAEHIVDKARPIQSLLLDNEIPPSLVIVEAPMGEGKTEAAWILVEKWRSKGCRGTYMALPTMATSDSLYARYRGDYLEKLELGGSVRLVHGMAWLRDENEPEKSPETGEPGDDTSDASVWFRPTRRAMLAAHGVGTVDQAMLAGMNVKFGFLRLYGLAGRVLIIDEVHAYDAYMSAIIGRLLQWCACLEIPVILLSATLSSAQRREMIEAYGAIEVSCGKEVSYPLVTVAETGKEVRSYPTKASSERTLKIELLHGMLGDARKVALKTEALVGNGGCCCVILNTVKQAQAVYRSLRIPEGRKLLFHARFTASDRQRITERVLKLFGKDRSSRPDAFVLVATQVVEQSLDVDFDHMISEIAPMDLLLQRSGREHRHFKRKLDPVLHVVLPSLDSVEKEPDFGGTGFVYAKKPLLRTLALLSDMSTIYLPSDFRMLVERCYGTEMWNQNAVSRELIEQADEEWEKDKQSLHGQGEQFALYVPDPRRFRPVFNAPSGDDSDDGNGWRATTRLGANDRTAVLLNEERISFFEKGDLKMKEVRDLYRQALKLPAYLPIFKPSTGSSCAVEPGGKLKGLVLLPLNSDGVWRGQDKDKVYEVAYDKEAGLEVRRVE